MHVDIAIIGAGIAGLVAGLKLKQLGYNPIIFEKSGLTKTVGGGLGIWPNGTKVLYSLGLKNKLEKLRGISPAVTYYSSSGKLLRKVPICHYQIKEELPALFLKRSDLQELLISELGEKNIIKHKLCVSLTQTKEKVTIIFQDGSALECNYLIAADGANSEIRRVLLGRDIRSYAGHISLGGIIKRDYPRQNFILDHQKLYANFPCSNNQSYVIMFIPFPLGSLNKVAPLRRQQLQLFSGWSQEVDRSLNHLEEENYFCLESYVTEPLEQTVFGRIAIVGDAAHAMTPISGLAASLAIEDVDVLTSVIHENLISDKSLQIYSDIQSSRMKKFQDLSTNFFLDPFLQSDKKYYLEKINTIEFAPFEKITKNLIDLTQN